jgi:hypothetical protein
MRTSQRFEHLVFRSKEAAPMIHPQPPMHREDLMKPDLLSEIVLVASGLILFIPLLLILVAACTQSVALR